MCALLPAAIKRNDNKLITLRLFISKGVDAKAQSLLKAWHKKLQRTASLCVLGHIQSTVFPQKGFARIILERVCGGVSLIAFVNYCKSWSFIIWLLYSNIWNEVVDLQFMQTVRNSSLERNSNIIFFGYGYFINLIC